MLTKGTRIWTQKVHLHSVSRTTKVNRFRLDKKTKIKKGEEEIAFCGQTIFFFGGGVLKNWGKEMVKHG